ncbi:hypothetical protein [Sphingopyxis sp.]|uniref:hypothetical protein n=1 Tax=Sphingopyxis sp. TaxID=1908224 RepID=UPI003D0E478C
MIKMSIGAAFSETFAFIRTNWAQMLAWTAGAVVLLALLGYLVLGSTFTAMAMAPADPSVAMGAVGRMFLFGLFAAVVLYAVCMLVWRSGLHPGEAPNFGWALQAGPAFAFGMFVVFIAAYIVVMILAFVMMLIFGAAFAGAGGFSPTAFQSGAMGGGAIALMIVFYLAILVFFLWLFGRLSVAGPVMADRLTRNPLTGITESWRITAASQWTIVGFYVLVFILSLVYGLVAGMIFGGIMGAAASGGSGVGAIISIILMALVVYVPQLLLSFALPVGIYRAIAPRASADVFS